VKSKKVEFIKAESKRMATSGRGKRIAKVLAKAYKISVSQEE
jgi:hypothetical protein